MTCRDWYQPGALLASEEGVIIAGLLVGLNTIDYNVVMKGEDFDKPVRIDIVRVYVYTIYRCMYVCISILCILHNISILQDLSINVCTCTMYIPEHEITVGHLTFSEHFWC